MKNLISWMYKNWILGILVAGCFCFLFCSGMLKICQSIVSTVKFPAYNRGIYYLSTGEPYILGYDIEGEFSIFTEGLNEVFSAYDVEVAIPKGNVVIIQYKDGRETEVNVLTREIDEGGILL